VIIYKYERDGLRIEQQSEGAQFPNMQLLSVLVLVAATSSALAAPAPVTHVLHEKRESAPRAWVKRSRVDPTIILPVRIGLRQNNLERGSKLLDEVYVMCLSCARALRSILSFSLVIIACLNHYLTSNNRYMFVRLQSLPCHRLLHSFPIAISH